MELREALLEARSDGDEAKVQALASDDPQLRRDALTILGDKVREMV